MNDDDKRRLRVVQSNPSLRVIASPKSIKEPLQVRSNNQPLRVTTAPPQQLRVTQSPRNSQPAYVQAPAQLRVSTPPPRVAPPPPRPQQSFFNKVRDVLDANTDADRYRRLRAGQPEMYSDQQIAQGNLRAPKNVGDMVLGNTARLINTAKAGLGGAYGIAQIGRESLFGNDESYQRRLNEVGATLRRDLSPDSGLFGAGTAFANAEEASNLNFGDFAKKTVGSGVGTAGEVLPFFKGAQIPVKAGSSLLARGGARLTQGALEGAAGEFGYQAVTQENVNPTSVAIAGVFGGSLNVATGSFFSALENRKAGNSSISRTVARDLADSTDENFIRKTIKDNTGLSGEALDDLVTTVKSISEPNTIVRTVDGTVDLIGMVADEANTRAPQVDPSTAIDGVDPTPTNNPVLTQVQKQLAEVDDQIAQANTAGDANRLAELQATRDQLTQMAEEATPSAETVPQVEQELQGSGISEPNEQAPVQSTQLVDDVASTDQAQVAQQVSEDATIRPQVEDRVTNNPDIPEDQRQFIVENKDRLKQQYVQEHPDNIVNADDVRDLLAEIGYNRKNAAQYHEAASALSKEILDEQIARLKPGDNFVFMAGSSGAGKGTALRRLGLSLDDFEAGLDGTFSSGSALKSIDKVIEQGGRPTIIFVAREPQEAWLNGVVKRALNPEDGRTVPFKVFAQSLEKSPQTVLEAIEKYGDKIDVQVVQNFKDGTQLIDDPVDYLRKLEYNDIRDGKFIQQLKQKTEEALKEQGASDKELVKQFFPEDTGQTVGRTDGASPQQEFPQQVVDQGNTTRSFKKTLANDPQVSIAVWEDIFGYTPTTNREVLAAAANRVNADQAGVLQRIRETAGALDNNQVAEAEILLRRFIDENDMPNAKAIAQKLTVSGTDSGRAIQQLAAFRKTTPEGAIREAYKIIDEANTRYAGKGKQYDLDTAAKDRIVALAENVQQYKPGTRERQVAEALLGREVGNVVPASIGEKVATAQVYAQLLNAKTAIRNLGGNGILGGSENVSTAAAVPIDFLISKIPGRGTGTRTIARPRFMKRLGGAATGLKYGAEDVRLGIRTIGEGGKFEIKSNVFRNKVGQALDKLLGYELQVPDKAFYMAQYEETLDSLMRAQKVSKPTREMLEIANEEALYATFQNNSALAGVLSKTKRALNVGKKFGVGDLVLKYPKTPGNIVSVGMDYSPWGFGKGIWQIAKATEGMSVAQQREAARNIGRSLTGSGLIMGGYYLAQNNIITANPSSDKDVRSLQRSESTGAYSFNVSALQRLVNGEDTTPQNGDVVANYDWAQPTAIALSMGASMADSNKDSENALSAALASAAAGTDTITQQPVVKNVTRFIDKAGTSSDRGGGVIPALTDTVQGAPSSFNPSILRQATQVIDPKVRQTYDPNIIQESYNRVKAGIPGLSSSLPEYKNSFGESIDRFSGSLGKQIFDSFINPAFVNKIARTPEGQMVFDIYNSTGDTKQFPRVADESYTINGEKRQLSAQEFNDYQTYIGQKTQEAFSALAANESFMKLSDEEKANAMSSLISDIGQAARIEVLGAEYNSVPNGVKKIMNQKIGEFTGKVPEGVNDLAKTYFEHIAYMDDDSKEAWLRDKNPSNISRNFAAVLNEDRPDGVAEIAGSNQIAKLYADFLKNEAENNWSKVEQINKRQELWGNIVKASHSDVANEVYSIARDSSNELKEFIARGLIEQDALDAAIQLDNELYQSGLRRTLAFNKKFRDAYGYIVPEVVGSVAELRESSGTGSSSGGGRKGKLAPLKKANVGGFRLNFAGSSGTAAPKIKVTPNRVRLNIQKPKATNVTPVQLKL